MDEVEYNIQLQNIINLSVLVRSFKIAEVLQAMNRADALGPILDPSLWIRASTKPNWQRKLAEAALTFQREVEQIAKEESARGMV